MSDNKDLHVKLDELLSANSDISSSERALHLQDLGNCLPNSYVRGIDQKLYNVLKVYLHSKNFELQKCALNLLHTCLQNRNLATLTDALSLNLAFAVVFICNNAKDDVPEHQELWLKGFETLQLMSHLHPALCKNHGTRLLTVFKKALDVNFTSNVQKLKTLLMLDTFMSYVDRQNVREQLYHVYKEQLLPLAFSTDNPELFNLCIQVSHHFIPCIREVLMQYPEEWENIFTDICDKYVSVIERLIAENNSKFANLWIFLIKLIGSKFHKGSPVVNALLSCIEVAFKVPNLEVRKQSFYCWQVLIESFSMESSEIFTEKRIKLLTIPLKTNNGKTEELVNVKIIVWCKLLELLHKNNLIGSFGVLDAYLGFCFGPLRCIPLLYQKDSAPALISQGKRYPSVHLTTCKTLLQLIGNPAYIDKELESKLNVLQIKPPAIRTVDFIELSKNIIDSVGESCVMLSQLDPSDRLECTAINEALWKSLFHTIDHLNNQNAKIKSIGEIAVIILALINVARRKANLINFGLKPLFTIITSNEFSFCQEEQFAKDLFIPMIEVFVKRDKILLHDDVVTILKSVFVFKRISKHYLEFINDAVNLLLKENTANAEKINTLSSIWYIIEDELLNFDIKTVDEKLYFNVFNNTLNWPITTLKSAKSNEQIDLKWRELYSFFCKTASSLLQSKLSCTLMHKIRDLVKETPNNITIAEYAYYIVSNLKLDDSDKEICEEISQIYLDIRMIVYIPVLTPEIVKIYESCVSHMLDTSAKFSQLHYLLPAINGCLTSLIDVHKKTDILRPATLFHSQVDKNDDKLKNEYENLTKILEKYKNTVDHTKSSIEVDTNIFKCDKEQALILLGHDINTMTPVKLKGSMLKMIPEKQSPSTDKSPRTKSDNTKDPTPNSAFVFVNSPYKFDPKKLTKQQRERLSRRRDDIPALYQDLTQSNDFNSSNSESLLTNLIQTKDSITAKNKTENKEEPPPVGNVTKETNESSHSEDVIQFDAGPVEKNTRVKRRPRKSVLSYKVDASEPNPPEKKKRGRKRKYPLVVANTSPSFSISKENMDTNKIPSNSDDHLTIAQTRRSSKMQETIESVVENTTLDTPENSQSTTTTEIDSYEPFKFKISNKSKHRAKIFKLPIEAKKGNLQESETSVHMSSKESSEIQETSSISEKKSLINLEANTELNKLENMPIYLGRPAKILRGARRVSEGNFTNKPIAEKNIIDYANLFVSTSENGDDDKVKRKVIRELKNIHIDIKNSDEYLKMNGRKTRLGQQTENTLRTRSTRQANKSLSKIDENQSESEESDVIASSQENEQQMDIKECEVRALYSLEKITSGTLLQESDPSNRPKISPIKINIKSNKLVKNDSPNSKNVEEKETVPIPEQSLIMDHLESQNTPLGAETQSVSSQLSQSNSATEDLGDRRNVILTSSSESTESETPSTPQKLPNMKSIITSPVSNDTPTRNKELVEGTLEISPIKMAPNKSANADEVPVTVDTDLAAEDNESPELFESETTSQKVDDPEKVSGNSSQYSSRTLRKNKSRVLSGRSAKMMKMISAKQTFVPTTSAKTSTVKTDNYCSPSSSNRTKKMMNNLEKCDVMQDLEMSVIPVIQASTNSEPLITQNDVLCIGKELPSPFALPTVGILKRKRTTPEETTEESAVPIKKRRVNFSDPPVSCLKFIEKIIKPASCFSKHLPKELRTTRASSAEELEIESELNADQESQSLSDIVPIEEDVEPEPEISADIVPATSKSYDNTNPICEPLINNQEPISKIVAKLTNSLDFVEPVITVMENKNIETIGDLAKLTESQVHIIPLKVETVKSVLKEYYESQRVTPTKAKRKITPLILSSPQKGTSTCEVSVIIDNRDVISETQSTCANNAVVEGKEEEAARNTDFSEKLFSSDIERIETPSMIKVKAVAGVSSSPESLFASPVSRIVAKSEFDSPTHSKDNILNEEYCNVKVAKFIQFLRNSFIQKKFDPRPMIGALFANNTEILKHMNCWEDLVKYVVRDIGIWTLTKYLCGLKNIPALMIESILKNSLNEIGNDFICERLNKHEIIKFLSKEYNLITLLQEYEAQTVYTTFFDLANDNQYSHLKYKEMLQELYACLFQPHIEICHFLYKLDVEHISDAVVNRMNTPNDMDTFLEEICKRVPLEVYLKPTKKQPETDTSKAIVTITKKKPSELVSDVVHCINDDELSKEDELKILRSIAKKWNALEFFQTFTQHTKQK